jgi:hypothetical protein
MKAAMIFGAALALLEEQRQKVFAIQEEHRQEELDGDGRSAGRAAEEIAGRGA